MGYNGFYESRTVYWTYKTITNKQKLKEQNFPSKTLHQLLTGRSNKLPPLFLEKPAIKTCDLQRSPQSRFTPQSPFTCSNSTMETSEKCVKSVQS